MMKNSCILRFFLLLALLLVVGSIASCGDDDPSTSSGQADDDDAAADDDAIDDDAMDDDTTGDDDDSVSPDDDSIDDDDDSVDDDDDDDDTTVTTMEGDPAYNLAQGCFAVRSDETGRYLVAEEDGSYLFRVVFPEQADHFFIKPTGLGTFMFYDRNEGFLATDGQAVVRYTEAGNDVEWRVNELEIPFDDSTDKLYTLVSTKHERRLLADYNAPYLGPEDDTIVAESAAFQMVERPAEECRSYPEAALNAVVSPEFYQPHDPTEPVVGYADVHSHLNFVKSLGAVGMAGDLFHRFGVEYALDDCEDLHGPDGAWDFLGVSGGTPGHDTAGYPDFTWWPNRCAISHTQVYYKWIQRAYLSGLRLVVTLATGNNSYCQLASMLHPLVNEGDCSPVSTVEIQTLAMYDLQDYVDAQEGGPGKGWFRIVTSPEEAREVIAQNKLAVVLGVEYGTLFDCRIGQEEKCTPEYVDQELDALYDMGIRSVYPLHRFDNAFGGTRPGGGTTNAWMNLTNKMNTGKIDHIIDLILPGRLLFDPSVGGDFWMLGECPAGASGWTNIRNMQEFLDEDIPSFGSVFDDLLQALLIDKLEPIPDYGDYGGSIPGCNVRHLQPIGEHLVNGLVDRGMIVQVDHLSYYTLIEMLDVLEERQYAGVISDHSWIENKLEIRDRIYTLGGLVVNMVSNPSNSANGIAQRSDEMLGYPLVNGVGIGSDVQGMTCQPNSDGSVQIDYPFTSYDGLVTFEQPTVGDRVFDYASEGVAHYGLYAEWVENLRQVDETHPADVMEIFMSSAEAYLQMWERAQATAIPRR